MFGIYEINNCLKVNKSFSTDLMKVLHLWCRLSHSINRHLGHSSEVDSLHLLHSAEHIRSQVLISNLIHETFGDRDGDYMTVRGDDDRFELRGYWVYQHIEKKKEKKHSSSIWMHQHWDYICVLHDVLLVSHYRHRYNDKSTDHRISLLCLTSSPGRGLPWWPARPGLTALIGPCGPAVCTAKRGSTSTGWSWTQRQEGTAKKELVTSESVLYTNMHEFI